MPRKPYMNEHRLNLLALISARPVTVHGDTPTPRADRPTPAFEYLLEHDLVELGEPDENGGRLATATESGLQALADAQRPAAE